MIRIRRRALSRRHVTAWTIAAVLVVACCVLAVVEWPPSGGSSDLTRPAESATSTPLVVEGPGLSLGSYGVAARSTTAENARPGTTDWQIGPSPASGYIQGWASTTDAEVGDTVALYVSTTALQFHAVAYRMGYYQGTGAREVWNSAAVMGQVQPACPVTPGINMVSCANWTASVTMPVTLGFVQGDYLLKLVGTDGEQSYVPLTISDPHSTATYLFETHSLTAEAWNDYGGFSFYQGTGPCAKGTPAYPVCNRARIASFDRPYLDGHGAGDFLYNEYPLLRFMEQHGLDVNYVTDVALDSHPEMMLQHKAFLSLGHDETWTYAARKGLQDAVAQGVNVAFLSAAAIVRHARLQASPIGPDREVVEYRDANEDPLNGKGDPMQVTGNTWAAPPTNWPVNAFIGQQYSGYLQPDAPNVPFVVHDASAWIFKGTGLQDGSTIPGVINSDIDHLDTRTTPANLQVLGHSPVPLAHAFTSQGKWGDVTYSDMTYYTNATSEAGIFDSGTVGWINALSHCDNSADCGTNPVQQMTANLLWLFGQGPAGINVPSAPNWNSVAPPGS